MAYPKQLLIKLKIVLQSNKLYFILGLFLFLYVILFTKIIKYESVFKDETVFQGEVIKYEKKDDKVTIYLKSKQKIIVNYYEDIDIKIGDKIDVQGSIKDIIPRTIPNTFDYQKYLYNNHIYTQVTAQDIKVLSHSNNILVKLKNFFIPSKFWGGC